MKKIILLLFFPLLCNNLLSQQKAEADKLVKEGVVANDMADYKVALKKYNKALEIDKDNLLALAEKARTMMATERYDECIELCQLALEKHPGENDLKLVYNTLGMVHERMKNTEKAISYFDEGIKLFKTYQVLYYNKAILLMNAKRFDEAIPCFQRSVALKPEHLLSHYYLGILLYEKKEQIPALLALIRVIQIDPQSLKVSDCRNLINNILFPREVKNAPKANPNNFNRLSRKDTAIKENDFSSIEFILKKEILLDSDKKYRREYYSISEIRKFNAIFTGFIQEIANNRGFYWDYYVPYFIAIKENNTVEPFYYSLNYNSNDPMIYKEKNKLKQEIQVFREWTEKFLWTIKYNR